MQYLASSCLANATLPTTGSLRAAMSPSQLGSDVFSHSYSISLRQSLGSLYVPTFMALSMPGVNFSTSPMLYQSALSSRSSLNTANRSLGPSTVYRERTIEHYRTNTQTKNRSNRYSQFR